MAKRALVVGINDYQGSVNDLPSCVKDTESFESLLRGSPYSFTDVTTYRDYKATVENVENGLKWLFDGAKPDDVLVFFFSGHGYSSPKNEVLQEYLVLYDDLFQDDRLSELSQVLPSGVLFTVVLDSCFSGGMEKRVYNVVEGERAKVKAWSPPRDLEDRDVEAEKSVKRLKVFGANPIEIPGFTPTKEYKTKVQSDETKDLQFKGLLLAACLETETAAASTSQTKGMSAFTCCFLDALADKGTNATVDAVIEATLVRLRTLGFGQTPVIKHPKSLAGIELKPFLSGGEVKPGPANGVDMPTDEDDLRRLASIIEILMAMEGKAFRFPGTPGSSPNCSSPGPGFHDVPNPIFADLMDLMKDQSFFSKSNHGTKKGDPIMTETTTSDKRWTDYVEPALAILTALQKGGSERPQAEPATGEKRWTDYVKPALAILEALQTGGNGAKRFHFGNVISTPILSVGTEVDMKQFQSQMEPIIILAQKLAEMDGGGGKDFWRDAASSIRREVARGASSLKPEDLEAALAIVTALQKGGAERPQGEPATDEKRWTDYVKPALAILEALQGGGNGAKRFRFGNSISTSLFSVGTEVDMKRFQSEMEPVVKLAQKLAEMDPGGEKGWLQDAGRSINREVRRGASSLKPEDVIQVASLIAAFA